MPLTRDDLLELLLSTCRFCVCDALNGNLEPYLYNEQHTEHCGIYDANYNNRFRLIFGLFYSPTHFPKEQCETLIRTLFLEELKDRRNNSFQGIGMNLELLTALLYDYHNPSDQNLFEQASKANADCTYAYVPKQYYQLSRDLKSESQESQIYDTIELGYFDIAKSLIACWKTEIRHWTPEHIANLQTWSNSLYDMETERFLAKQQFESQTKQSTDKSTIVASYESYIQTLLALGQFEEAYQIFLDMKPHLLSICQNEHSKWYESDFGQQALSYALDFILYLSSLKTEEMKSLWKYIKPYVLSSSISHHSLFRQRILEVSQLMKETSIEHSFS